MAAGNGLVAAWASQEAGLEEEAAYWLAQRDAFDLVTRVVAGEVPLASASSERLLDAACGLHRRTLDALAGIADDATGPSDIAALLGAVLRREASRPGRTMRPHLNAPAEPGWPGESEYERAGLDVVRVGGLIRITSRPWRPIWLECDQDPLKDVDAPAKRRHPRPVPSDPFYASATGFPQYASVGQREAVRAVVRSRPGDAVIASLPTGTGKTSVGLFTALMPRARGTTVVFVPTVSLARDQEAELAAALDRGAVGRRMRHRSFAYIGDSTEPDKTDIRDRIMDGDQGVVFLAPESARGLRGTLTTAAKAGLLTALVIDEAHMVADWGTDFRPEFQALAGLRRGLLESCAPESAFVTILLTATLTEQALLAVSALVADPASDDLPNRATRIVVQAGLRPEPSWWIAECRDEPERVERLKDALLHLPRPAIVYVNYPAEAEDLAAVAGEMGFRRVATYTGQTDSHMRRSVEIGWRGSRGTRTIFDVVIANSAFGLGINQDDVRCVIHARLPESINRLYQEVGRGGRDGRASVALTLSRRDVDLASTERIVHKTLLRARLEPRWHTMFQEAIPVEHAEDGWLWVNLETVAFDRRGRHEIAGQRNYRWNQNALTLLQRSGLVALGNPGVASPPRKTGSWECLKVLDDRVYTEEWREAWAKDRELTAALSKRERSHLVEFVRACEPTEHTLRRALTVGVSGGRLVVPNATCGGCPRCREAGYKPTDDPAVVTVAEDGVEPSPLRVELRTRLGEDLVLVRHTTRELQADEHSLIRSLVARGAARMYLSPESGAAETEHSLPGEFVLVESDLPSEPWYSWQETVEIVAVPKRFPSWVIDPADGVTRIVFVPEDAVMPSRPDRLLVEMRRTWTAGNAREVLGWLS
jgi:superfamily II DNA or RNA helicase